MNEKSLENTADLEDSEFGELLARDLSEDLGGDTEGYVRAAEANVEASPVESKKITSKFSEATARFLEVSTDIIKTFRIFR